MKYKDTMLEENWRNFSGQCQRKVSDFYETLEETVDKVNKRDLLIGQGDWNSQIGSDSCAEWKGTVGKFGLNSTNKGSENALMFVKRYNLVVTNTLLQHEISTCNIAYSKWTEPLPDRLHYDKAEKQVREITPRLKYNVNKLQDPNIAEQFSTTIDDRFAPLLFIDNIHDQTQEFTKVVNKTALEVLGKRETMQIPTNGYILLESLKTQAVSNETVPEIVRSEVEYAVKCLKNNKAAGVDNIPGELIKYGGETMVSALLSISNKILHTERAIECTLDDAQAEFRPRRSTVEQRCNLRCNLRVIGEKYINHQMAVYNNYIDYKKAFDRVWHDALWSVLEKHGIDTEIMRAMKNLYQVAESAVQIREQRSNFFNCGVGVRQGCILSPMLFNAFLEEIITRAHEGYNGGVTIQGRKISNLRFADGIDLITSSEKELLDLTSRLEKVSRSFRMEISAEKSKPMVISNKAATIEWKIEIGSLPLEQVSQFHIHNARVWQNIF
ncbi:uncharacterized protein LOC134767063 [Penaeus indicus]|uniref:uncharacterized protein LOC134767063 n=1 Tax=Penaeus indicus TaxID=29960 RepID=UPI00300C0690